MKITLENYEAYFLDFVEGRLDNSSTLEMLAFLRKHPELKTELESFGEFRLQPEDISYREKELLKKFHFGKAVVNERNFEDFCIAHYEKLLTPAETDRLMDFLSKNPSRRNDFLLYGKVHLKADPDIIFEAKPFLKRKPAARLRTIVLRWTAVAAGIVLAVSVFYNFPEKEPKITTGTSNMANVPLPSGEAADENPAVARTENVVKPTPKTPKKAEMQNSPRVDIVEPVTEPEQLAYLTPLQSRGVEAETENTAMPLVALSSRMNSQAAADEEMELFDRAGKMIREKVLKQQEDAPVKKITLWDIAEVTLKGYNRISEKDVFLHRKVDEKGKLTAIALETENRRYGFETRN